MIAIRHTVARRWRRRPDRELDADGP
jgi:hypothetical protein